MEKTKITKEEQWQRLYDYVGGKEGEELTSAFRDLYTIYEDKIIEWYAGLYDPKIGGYYYSNSARDNEGFLPDAEATFHSVGIWPGLGVNGGITEWGKWLPEWMQKQVGDFIYNLQDEDGFFYHPQWGKNIPISRRARDLMWSTHILDAFGYKPKYKTIVEAGRSGADKKTLIPEHLRSEENFAKYLEGLNINERSYHSGNELTAQSSQLNATGRMQQALDFLTAHQHPETGHWHHVSNYYAVNGLFKICGMYSSGGRPFPNAMAAARAAIDAITSDEPMGAVVDLYNTWYTVHNLLLNLRKYGGEEGNRNADEIVNELRKNAPAAIRKSKEKIFPFKKPDGGFSYGPNSPSPTSQGVPVAIPGLPESDENATIIASCGLVGKIYAALELSEYVVPIFGDREREKYIALLEAKRQDNE